MRRRADTKRSGKEASKRGRGAAIAGTGRDHWGVQRDFAFSSSEVTMRQRQSLFHKRCGLCAKLTHVRELVTERVKRRGTETTVKVCLFCLGQHGGDRGVIALLRAGYSRSSRSLSRLSMRQSV